MSLIRWAGIGFFILLLGLLALSNPDFAMAALVVGVIAFLVAGRYEDIIRPWHEKGKRVRSLLYVVYFLIIAVALSQFGFIGMFFGLAMVAVAVSYIRYEQPHDYIIQK